MVSAGAVADMTMSWPLRRAVRFDSFRGDGKVRWVREGIGGEEVGVWRG